MAIVVTVDRSGGQTELVREGKALGDAFGEDVHVVHVLSQSDFIELERTAVDKSGKPANMDEVKSVARDIAQEAADGVDGTFIAEGLVGNVPDQIARYADKQDARYIVIGGRKRSPTGKAIFGSTTQTVLLNSSRPVVTVMSNREGV